MFEKFKEALYEYGNIENYTLCRKFKNVTNSGQYNYYLFLFYFDRKDTNLHDMSYLLTTTDLSSVKKTKEGHVVGYNQIYDYIQNYIPELKQLVI
jgi:hypothetical protein